MGLPAARVSDMAIRVGQTDPVILGGFTVTIGGTSGVILPGGPTVLIG